MIFNEIIDIFLKTVFKIIDTEKKIQKYNTNKILYSSEINMIDVIGRNNNTFVSELAVKMQVTKGAISQVIMKLGKKGMIRKRPDPNNKSRYLLSLTKQGKIAFDEHKRLNELFITYLNDILDKFNDDYKNNIFTFLKEVNYIIEKM